MSIYGHALFWSAIACVLAAVVVCALVVRYGFTRDSDPAGRWGRPTRAGHGVAAALFGTGIALAILALTAVPLGGKERPLGDRLRAQLEALRGRLGAFENAVARLGDEGARRVLPAERRQARAVPAPSAVRTDATATDPALAALRTDMPRGATIAGGGHAVVEGPAAPPPPKPTPSVEPRPDRSERRTIRPEARPVAVVEPATRPAPIEITPPPTPAPPVVSTPPAVNAPPPQIARTEPVTATPPARDRDADVGKPRDRDGNAGKPDADVVQSRDRDADRAKPNDKPAKADREMERQEPLAADAGDKPARAERGDKQGRPDRLERVGFSDRPDRVELADRVSRPERIDVPTRPERPDRPEKIEKVKPEKFERPERGGKR